MTQLARPVDGQPPLIATKTFVRRAREGLVARPHLIARLDEAAERPLTLISATAGFGKTTLIAEWLRSRPQRACWLSLDPADNDPCRFLSYVIAALQRAVSAVGDDLVHLLRSPQHPAIEAVVTALVNHAVNRALTFLLENMPSNVHLVISTRSGPSLPVARLRSRAHPVSKVVAVFSCHRDVLGGEAARHVLRQIDLSELRFREGIGQ